MLVYRVLMKHYMICVSGFSGVGKDEFCSRLVKNHGAVQTGLADPMKRHMADLFGFSEEQLFGPSIFRNAGDIRYPKEIMDHAEWFAPPRESSPSSWIIRISDKTGVSDFEPMLNHWSQSNDPKLPPVKKQESNGITEYVFSEGDPSFWLSPREALQKYGELMNNLYLNSWIRKGIEDHVKIASGSYSYSRMGGVKHTGAPTRDRKMVITCFSDFRHWHEIRAAKSSSVRGIIPVLVRIKSKRVPNPPYQHRSELEQTTIPDSEFNFIIHNDKGVDELHKASDRLVHMLCDNSHYAHHEITT